MDQTRIIARRNKISGSERKLFDNQEDSHLGLKNGRFNNGDSDEAEGKIDVL